MNAVLVAFTGVATVVGGMEAVVVALKLDCGADDGVLDDAVEARRVGVFGD